MRITFDIAGDVQFDREILRLTERAEDVKPAFEHIVDRIEGWERQQFETEGGRASSGWRPIKQSTIDAKRRAGLDTRILHATHALRDSLTNTYADGAIREIGKQELKYGTEVPYAGVHQRGRKDGTMPARKPLEFREDDRRQIVKDLQAWIVRGEFLP